MIHEEDIIKIRMSQKDASHENTRHPYRKNQIHRNTHHTRQGGRTDHSTSSHGLVPSSTDRVMKVILTWGMIITGYIKIWARDTWELIKIIHKVIG